MPVYGFGAMLFITFVACYWLIGRRAEKAGVPKQYLQDLAIWIFVGGIIGARIVFMIQYGIPIWQFHRIWEGGLVFYGSAIGGLAAYLLGYIFIIRKHGLDTLVLADIIAPCVALGLSLGRIGCLLNGCCYGHVACTDCWSVHFPLSAPARFTLVQSGLQTAAGFAVLNSIAEPRSVVTQVEPDSAAAKAGLRSGDIITAVEGVNNDRKFLEVWGTESQLARLVNQTGPPDLQLGPDRNGLIGWQFSFSDSERLLRAEKAAAEARVESLVVYDRLWDTLINNWPRGKTDLNLTVEHADGSKETLPAFVPQTIGLHPTQFYETVSTFLLFLVLLALEPLKPKQGMLMVVLMLGYSVHRFINESLRNDTATYGLLQGIGIPALSLSQWLSVVVFVGGLVLLAYVLLRKPTEPKQEEPKSAEPEAEPQPA